MTVNGARFTAFLPQNQLIGEENNIEIRRVRQGWLGYGQDLEVL